MPVQPLGTIPRFGPEVGLAQTAMQQAGAGARQRRAGSLSQMMQGQMLGEEKRQFDERTKQAQGMMLIKALTAADPPLRKSLITAYRANPKAMDAIKSVMPATALDEFSQLPRDFWREGRGAGTERVPSYLINKETSYELDEHGEPVKIIKSVGPDGTVLNIASSPVTDITQAGPLKERLTSRAKAKADEERAEQERKRKADLGARGAKASLLSRILGKPTKYTEQAARELRAEEPPWAKQLGGLRGAYRKQAAGPIQPGYQAELLTPRPPPEAIRGFEETFGPAMAEPPRPGVSTPTIWGFPTLDPVDLLTRLYRGESLKSTLPEEVRRKQAMTRKFQEQLAAFGPSRRRMRLE